MDLENLLELAKALSLSNVRTAAGNLVCSCPFAPYRHLKPDGSFGMDHKASFGISINEDGESYSNCFSCNSSGDLLYLCLDLGEVRGEDYRELEEFIWQNEGVGVLERAVNCPALSVADARKLARKKRASAVYSENDYAPFRGRVPRYALERGLPLEVCKAWDLGDDPAEGRLLFPIRNFEGGLVGLKGRSYRGHRNKYIPYLPFSQGSWFFGEHMLRPESEDPRIVIVEGEIDVIKVWMAGYSCLGMMGGFPTRTHSKRLEALGRPLVLMPDANETGERWAKSLGDRMKNVVNVFDVFLDSGDPGERSPDEIREAVEGASLRL